MITKMKLDASKKGPTFTQAQTGLKRRRSTKHLDWSSSQHSRVSSSPASSRTYDSRSRQAQDEDRDDEHRARSFGKPGKAWYRKDIE